MFASKTVQELLDAFSAPTPTPGGGSAAALAGAIAASLLAMVAAMPKTKSGTPEERAALDALQPTLRSLRAELVDLIDRDAASYDGVVAAYRLPKGTDEEKAARKSAVAAAMKHATDVPLQTLRAAVALSTHADVIAANGNPNASSDVGVAKQLAVAAGLGAMMNVETNLAGLSDAGYVAQIRREIDTLKVSQH